MIIAGVFLVTTIGMGVIVLTSSIWVAAFILAAAGVVGGIMLIRRG